MVGLTVLASFSSQLTAESGVQRVMVGRVIVNRRVAIAKRTTSAPGENRLHFSHDRNCDLLRCLRSQIESRRGEDVLEFVDRRKHAVTYEFIE